MPACGIYIICIYLSLPKTNLQSSFRCLGQEDPCEGISLGACFVEPGSILKTYTATPDRCSHLKTFSKSSENFFEIILKTFTKPIENLSTRCSKLCEMNNNCEFWRAQWDGTLCHLLSSDYQHVSAQITLLQRFLPGLWIICRGGHCEGLHWGSRLLLCLCWGRLCLHWRESRWGGGVIR